MKNNDVIADPSVKLRDCTLGFTAWVLIGLLGSWMTPAHAEGTAPPSGGSGSGTVVLIHTGDIHGHLMPRPNLRSDATRRSLEEGASPACTP